MPTIATQHNLWCVPPWDLRIVSRRGNRACESKRLPKAGRRRVTSVPGLISWSSIVVLLLLILYWKTIFFNNLLLYQKSLLCSTLVVSIWVQLNNQHLLYVYLERPLWQIAFFDRLPIRKSAIYGKGMNGMIWQHLEKKEWKKIRKDAIPFWLRRPF